MADSTGSPAPNPGTAPNPGVTVAKVVDAISKVSGSVKVIIVLITILFGSVGLNIYLIKSNTELGNKLSIKKTVENNLAPVFQTKQTNAQGIIYIYITNKEAASDLLSEVNQFHTNSFVTNLKGNNLNVSLSVFNKVKLTRDIDIDFTLPDFPAWEFTGTVWLFPDIEIDASGGYKFIPRIPIYFGASIGYETVLKQAKLGVNVTYLK